mmetsp:Transcript_25670/g.55772  ORF Transcript_25670/g.55772 Transcript_25670/m.55772 type:complete len:95 (-) Transcript_25670:1362-1646(-)
MGCGASAPATASDPGAGAAAGAAGAKKPVDPASLLGKEIVIKDLERRSDLNGIAAKVEHYIKERGRFMCKVESTGETISISEDKVQLLGYNDVH